MFSWMKSTCCAMAASEVVNDSRPGRGNGAMVRRESAPAAFSTAPRIQASIFGLTSLATTSMPKCSARAAQPPPMTPVPSRPSVFTCLM